MMIRVTKTSIFILVLSLLFLLSCNNNFFNKGGEEEADTPTNNVGKTGSVKISYKIGSSNNRTVVADFSVQITSWTVTLSQGGYTRTSSSTTNGPVEIKNVEIGEWAVLVQGKNDSDEVVASGNGFVTVVEGQDSNCDVKITFSQSENGSGSMFLKLVFPISTDITDVSADLYRYSDSSHIQFFNFNFTDFTTKETNYSVTFTNDALLQSGAYQLVINFKRGTIDAGTFREAINIWDNVISNKWIGSNGTLLDYREFSGTDFFNNNANLQNVTFNNIVFLFSSVDNTYDLDITTDSFTFTPTQSIGGQKIEYDWNAGGYTGITSGSVSVNLNVNNTETNTLIIKVTAPDRQTIKEYRFNITRKYRLIYDGNGATGGTAPEGTNYDYNNIATILGNTGNLTKTNSLFAGWNTNANGSGTPYCKDETIDMTTDITLFAQWVKGEFWIAGQNKDNSSAIYNIGGSGAATITPNILYKDIFVKGNDMYIAGRAGSDASLYKNSVSQFTLTNAEINSVFEINGKVLVCGKSTDTNIPFYCYDNGAKYTFGNNTSTATDICSDGVNIYITGSKDNKPYIFISNIYSPGAVLEKELSASTMGAANAVIINDYVIYVVGVIQGAAYFWTSNDDGKTFSAGTALNGSDVVANGIAKNGNDIYIVGRTLTGACYWYSSESTINFGDCKTLTTNSFAQSVAIIDNKAYIVGGDHSSPTYSNNAMLWTVAGAGTPTTYKLWHTDSTDPVNKNCYANSITAKNYAVTLYPTTTYGSLYIETVPAGCGANIKAFTKTGWTWDGWYNNAGLTGAAYLNGTQFSIDAVNADYTFYAKWTPPGTFAVGNIGPAGGYVFHDKGSETNGWRYMEIAPPIGLQGAFGINQYVWSTDAKKSELAGTEESLGSGKLNTQKIINQNGDGGDYAAKVATQFITNYNGVEYNDWFLPSYHEYDQIQINSLGNITGIGWDYWTSSEQSANSAYYAYGTSLPNNGAKYSGDYQYRRQVRPIRAFANDNPTYIVLYDGNGATTGAPPTDTIYHEKGAEVTVASKGALDYTYKYFSGWNTQKDGNGTWYTEGAKFIITNNVTLYAQWVEAVPISTPEELAAIGTNATTLSGSYFLMNDIDISTYNGGAWTPIGEITGSFTGTLDGNGKKITNLTISSADLYLGLFGMTSNTAMIKNLGIDGVNITNTANGSVAGHRYTGTLVGNNLGMIQNCYFINGNIKVENSIATYSTFSGGITGLNKGTVEKSFSSVNVKSLGSSGGIAGCNNESGNIIYCYAMGNIGGINGANFGGLVGVLENASIQYSYSTGRVTDGSIMGGLVGNALGVCTITASYYDKETSGRNDTGKGEPKTTALMKQQSTFQPGTNNWDFTNIWGMNAKNWGYPYLLNNYPANVYTVLYDANEGTGGVPPFDNTFYKTGDTVTVKDNTGSLAKTGYSLIGWTTDSVGTGTIYSYDGANTTIPVGTVNVTLYAKWSINNYTLNYEANGGSGTLPSSAVYQYNSSVTVPAHILSKSGFAFDGWTTNTNGWGKIYFSGNTFNMPGNDLTLYARFVAPINDFKVLSLVFANKSGGTALKLEDGDQIIITFSQAVIPSSIHQNMTAGGTLTSSSYTMPYLRISNDGNDGESDFYIVQRDTWNIGQLKLYGDMKNATSGPYYYCDAEFTSISLSANSKTLTITLGNISSLYINSFVSQTSSANIRFYPSGNIKRTLDNAFISQSEYYCNTVGITATF